MMNYLILKILDSTTSEMNMSSETETDLNYSQTPLVRTHRITRLNYVIMENTL